VLGSDPKIMLDLGRVLFRRLIVALRTESVGFKGTFFLLKQFRTVKTLETIVA
jgi:hypothetical protein